MTTGHGIPGIAPDYERTHIHTHVVALFSTRLAMKQMTKHKCRSHDTILIISKKYGLLREGVDWEWCRFTVNECAARTGLSDWSRRRKGLVIAVGACRVIIYYLAARGANAATGCAKRISPGNYLLGLLCGLLF